MNSIDNFYEHLPPDGTPDSMVILLHGVGSNGQDLISLAPMWAQYVPQTVFVSPDAPFACDMAPPGWADSYQWFSLQNRDPAVMIEGVKTVFPLVEEFIATQLERYNLPLSRLVLAGFSQGTMTSLYVAPRLQDKIAGVLGYSGALLVDGDSQESLKNTPPLHLIHGEADDVVPVQAWSAAKSFLQDNGFTVTGHTTPGLGHNIDGQGIASGGEFLKHILC